MEKTVYVNHPRAYELAYNQLREDIEHLAKLGLTSFSILKTIIGYSEQFWDQEAVVEYTIHDDSFDYSYGSIDGTHEEHSVEVINVRFPSHFPNEDGELDKLAEKIEEEIII